MEIISNCCSAPEHNFLNGLCNACLEHADFISIEEEENTSVTREKIEEILRNFNVNY